MICPKCNEEIDRVDVESKCSQRGWLDGNQITSYDDLEVGQTLTISCPECGKEITEHVEAT